MTVMRSLVPVVALTIVAALWTPTEPVSAKPADPTSFNVDPAHSGVLYRVMHLDASPFWGRFNKVSGKISIDDENLDAANVEITVDATSVDSNSAGRDRHLSNQDFLNVKQFPTITFKSKSVKKVGESKYEITGALTLVGKTNTITFLAERTGAGNVNPRFGYRVGFEAVFTIKRSDYGMSYGVKQKILGDEVRMVVALEGTVAK